MRQCFQRKWMPVVAALAMSGFGAFTLGAQQGADEVMNRLRGEIAASPERLDLVLELGNAAVGAGQLDLALENFRQVLEHLEPDSRGAGDLHLRIGETYRRKGDLAAAIGALTRASELLPDQPVVMGTLALVLDGYGRKAEAERAYRSTLKLDAENAIAMNNLAFLLAERDGDLDEALRLAVRAGELVPEDADMIDTAGWVQWKRKQTDAAIGLFGKAVGMDPGNEGYRRHLLLAIEGKGAGNAAVDELKQLLTTSGDAQKIVELLRSVER
jgi:tetratricopeptide (TPR) repeat protein